MIRFTRHAIERIRERGISENLVLKTVTGPDFILPSRHKRQIAIRRTGNRYLKVVYIVEEDDIVVITSHWISQSKNKGNTDENAI